MSPSLIPKWVGRAIKMMEGSNASHRCPTRRHSGVGPKPARFRHLALRERRSRRRSGAGDAVARVGQYRLVPAGSNLPAWLFTILRNLFRSDYRKRRREVEDADGSYAKTLKAQPAQNAHLEFEEFRAALDKLPQDQREALILWRLRLLLRGRGRHLRLRGRHHQEPRQPRSLETLGAALCRRRR